MRKSIFCAVGLLAAASVFADDIVRGNCSVSDKLEKNGYCYQIATCGNLYKFAEMVKDEQNICGRLTADIEINTNVLDQYGSLNNVLAGDAKPLDWVPMGTAESPFRGAFLGDGHTIRGLFVENDDGLLSDVGFFGVIGMGAGIENLNIVDSYFTSKKNAVNVGSVAGSQKGAGIRNVHTGAYVKGVAFGATGGIVGKMTAGCISASYNTGKVESAGSVVGGLVGKAETDNLSIENVIENSFNSGSVTGNSEVGGLVGAMQNFFVENCYNHGAVEGNEVLGGLVGYNEGTVQYCYNTGRVVALSSNSSINCTIGTSKGSAEYIYNNSDICNIYNVFASFNATNITTAAFVQDGLPEGFEDEYWNAGYGDKGGDMTDFYINIRLPQINDIKGEAQPVDTVKIKFKDDILSKEEVSLSDVENTELVFDGGSYGSNDFEMTKATWGEDGYISGKFMGIEFTQDNVSIVFNSEYTSATIYGYSKNCTNADEAMSGVGNGNAVLKRSLVAKGYSTMMLPFSADIPNDSKASFHKFVDVAQVNGKWQVQVEETPVTKIVANTPYLVTVSEDVSSIEFANVYYETVNCGTYSKFSNGWELVGTYEYKEWKSGDAELGRAYGFAGINGYASEQIGKFGKLGAGAYIYPMRVYLRKLSSGTISLRPSLDGESTLPEVIMVVFVNSEAKISDETADGAAESGETTKVIGSFNTRTGEFRAASDHYFDLNGRSLGGEKPRAKGKFIAR